MKRILLYFLIVLLTPVLNGQTNYFTTQISSSADDAEENKSGGEIDLTSSDIEMCYDSGVLGIGSKNQWIGLRFTNIDIPKDAYIDSVFLQFTVKSSDDDPAIIQFYGDKFFNSPAFSDLDFNISARTRTDTSVYWTVSNWNNEDESGHLQTSPNFSGIFKEIIQQQLWQSGNSVTFIAEGSGRRSAFSYDNDSQKAARLHVYYRENDASLAVNELENVEVYPNPYNENIFVNLSDINTNEEVEVKIYAPDGRLVFSQSLLAGQKHNLADYGFDYKGIGFLTLSNQQFSVSKKIISH
ncbi:MAG: hypothetical protein COA32_08105 [Fluviicola sp.]|nr:MAG: hypothetical protein COA32_08105 [Fluviicola sp.]